MTDPMEARAALQWTVIPFKVKSCGWAPCCGQEKWDQVSFHTTWPWGSVWILHLVSVCKGFGSRCMQDGKCSKETADMAALWDGMEGFY